MHRELLFARRDRARHINRLKGLLAQPTSLGAIQDLPAHVVSARLWDGSPLAPRLRARLDREWATLQAHGAHSHLKTERRALLRVTDDPAIAQVRQLHQLVGVGIDGASTIVMEFFSWRRFRKSAATRRARGAHRCPL